MFCKINNPEIDKYFVKPYGIHDVKNVLRETSSALSHSPKRVQVSILTIVSFYLRYCKYYIFWKPSKRHKKDECISGSSLGQ